ncbi:hypothetical protein FHR47_002145 [Xanthomonas arboricola]|uniref:hypothetical protein n=2 Tax=Xanthomonas TaxID=338 RepID=UPI000F8C559D|nr:MULTISPECIES: hypothetical protein [Xanthomonas]MBB3801897.1 hypothetical protein [Xanthomonas cannabis]
MGVKAKMSRKFISRMRGLDDDGLWTIEHGCRAIEWSHPSIVGNVIGNFEATKDALGSEFFVPSPEDLRAWMRGVRRSALSETGIKSAKEKITRFVKSCIPIHFDNENQISVCSIEILDAIGDPVPGMPISYVIFSPANGGAIKMVIGEPVMREALTALASYLASRKKPAPCGDDLSLSPSKKLGRGSGKKLS